MELCNIIFHLFIHLIYLYYEKIITWDGCCMYGNIDGRSNDRKRSGYVWKSRRVHSRKSMDSIEKYKQ